MLGNKLSAVIQKKVATKGTDFVKNLLVKAGFSDDIAKNILEKLGYKFSKLGTLQYAQTFGFES